MYVFSALLIGVCSIPSKISYIKPPEPPRTDKQAILEYISFYAEKHAVSEITMQRVIACESGYKHTAIGDGGNSYGLVQIHLPSHPTITKEQATNPLFAVEFLAENLADGKGKLWTCYRKLIG